MCGILSHAEMSSACVPFPAPGPPNRITMFLADTVTSHSRRAVVDPNGRGRATLQGEAGQLPAEEVPMTTNDLRSLFSRPERPTPSALSVYLNVDQSEQANLNRGFET